MPVHNLVPSVSVGVEKETLTKRPWERGCAGSMLYQLSYEALQLGAGQFIGFLRSHERSR